MITWSEWEYRKTDYGVEMHRTQYDTHDWQCVRFIGEGAHDLGWMFLKGRAGYAARTNQVVELFPVVTVDWVPA